MSNNTDLKHAEQKVAQAEAGVAAAQAIVADLESKRVACVERGRELADERSSVAYDAHTGNQQAAARLEEIHQAITLHSSELLSVDSALRVAATKIETAQSDVVAEQQKLNALKLRTLSRAFTANAKRIDKALDDLVNGLYDIEPIRQQIEQLGGAPNFQQFVILGERPILLALADTVFEGKIGRHLAPHEKMTFSQLAASWTQQHARAIAHILGEQQSEPEAA
jgi:hypothetical protein